MIMNEHDQEKFDVLLSLLRHTDRLNQSDKQVINK